MVTMLKSKVDLNLLAVFLIASVVLLAISWPLPREKTQLIVSAGQVGNDEITQPALPFDTFMIYVDFPKGIRTYERTQASIKIAPDQWTLGDDVEKPGLMIETRIDLAGIQMDPSGIVSQPLTSKDGLSFNWGLEADQPGIYKDTLWIFLVNIDEGSSWPILAKAIEIRANEVLPITPAILRWVLGMVCLVAIFLLVVRIRRKQSTLI
jgi:hypothetical protein